MIEPTETESRRPWAFGTFARVLGQDADTLHAAPVTTSVRRVDEVRGSKPLAEERTRPRGRGRHGMGLIDLDGPGPKILFPLAWGHIGWALGWLFFIGGMSEILILAVSLGGLILACIPHAAELWHDPVRERTMLAVGGLIIWLSSTDGVSCLSSS